LAKEQLCQLVEAAAWINKLKPKNKVTWSLWSSTWLKIDLSGIFLNYHSFIILFSPLFSSIFGFPGYL
jgi:hypothetical protein